MLALATPVNVVQDARDHVQERERSGMSFSSLGSSVQKLPTFSSIKFSDNQVNAQDLSDWPQARYDLKTTSAVQIRTGALAANQSFVTTFAHN